MKSFSLFLLYVLITIILFSCSDNSTSPQTGNVQGTLTNKKTGAALANALITSNPPTASITTNENGTFNLKEIDPGIYEINAVKDGYYSGSTSIKVTAGKTTECDIQLLDFVSGNYPPNSPFKPSPSNDAIINKNNLTLKWSCLDPNDDKLKFKIAFDSKNPPVTVLTDSLSDSTFTITNLKDSTDYYWIVTATDIYGASAKSSIWRFHTNFKGSSSGTLTDYVAYYKFDGNANDDGPNAYNGTENDITYIQDRKNNTNSAIYFNGSTSYVKLDNTNMFDFQKDLTVALWVQPNTDNSSPCFTHIDLISLGVSNGSESGYLGITVLYEIEVWGNSVGIYNRFIGTTATLTPYSWSHLAFVFKYLSSNSTSLKIYINGIESASGILNTLPYYSDAIVKLGYRAWDGGDKYAGGMDELYIFDRVLSPTEIGELMK
jgi:hypothetical protein